MLRSLVSVVVIASACAGIARADMAAPPMERQERVSRVRIAPPRPPAPSPIATIAAAAKPVVGTWTCKGVQLVGDGSSKPINARLTVAVELAGAWIHERLVAVDEGGVALEVFRTFDPAAQQWTRMQVASDGSHATATSLGETDGMWTWVGEQSSQAGTVQERDYETVGATVKLWGEQLLGGVWAKTYELSCAR